MRIRVVLGVLAGSLVVVPVAGAATSPFVKLPRKWVQGPTVAVKLLGNTAFVVEAGFESGSTVSGASTKLTTGKVSSGKLVVTGAKSLGQTASFQGGGPVIVGSSLFVQQSDGTIESAALSTSGKAGPLKTSPIAAPSSAGVLAAGAAAGSRVVLAFTQSGFGVCCSDAGAPSPLGALGTPYLNQVAVGVDRRNHVLVAWLDDATATIRTVELDHSTLLPKTAAAKVIAGPEGVLRSTADIAVACGAVCHVVYGNGTNVYSWAPGDARPRKIIGKVLLFAGASVDRKGRLLTAYVKGSKLVVQRGDANGKGGKTTSAAIPATPSLGVPTTSFTSSRVLVAMTEQIGRAFQTVTGVLPLP